MPYLIADDRGTSLDARIDLEGSSVILHSQGGRPGVVLRGTHDMDQRCARSADGPARMIAPLNVC